MTDSPVSPGLLRFGVFEADPRTGELRKAGRKIAIQEQPFRTLLALLDRPGEVVTREDLRAKVWPADTFVDFDTGLNKAVRKIREALGDSADSPRFIETLPRRGYRFLAPVEVIGATTAPAPPVEAPPAEKGAPHRPRRLALPVAAAAVLLAALAGWAWWVRSDARPAIRSIAVLPLKNLSGDPNQQYFADGMTDELITMLAQIHSLRVISRTSVMRFRGVRRPLPDIARELNVDAVIEGSVLQSGGSVRVTAQLLDARQDRHLWAASYERRLTDVVGLQSQVAQAIAEQVKASLTPQEHTSLARRSPVNPDAYQAFLRGRFLWNTRRKEEVGKAIGYFRQAIQLQPDYARAWAGLAGCYMSLGGDMGVVAPGDAAPDARAAVAKALQIDSGLADGHLTLANIKLWYDWDWAGAGREYRRALDLSPNDSTAHRNYSHYLLLMRRFDEALAETRRALDLDPLDRLANAHLVWLYLDTHQPDKALAQSAKLLELILPTRASIISLAERTRSRQSGPRRLLPIARRRTTRILAIFAASPTPGPRLETRGSAGRPGQAARASPQTVHFARGISVRLCRPGRARHRVRLARRCVPPAHASPGQHPGRSSARPLAVRSALSGSAPTCRFPSTSVTFSPSPSPIINI